MTIDRGSRSDRPRLHANTHWTAAERVTSTQGTRRLHASPR